MQGNKIKVVLIRNPLKPEVREEWLTEYQKDAPLSAYLQGIVILRGVKLVAAIDGKIVSDSWDSVYPKEGSIISVAAEMEAGAAAAAVLKMTAAWGVFSYVAAAVTYVAVTMAVGFGINMLASAITGGYETPEADGNSSNSPTYSWGPLQPTEAEGYPIPIIYGEHRVAGQVINKFVTATNGSGEQETAKEYLNVLLSVGVGPVDEITDIRINEQPHTNYKDVKVYTRVGNYDDEPIPNFSVVVYQQNPSFTLPQGEIRTLETSGDMVDSLEVVITAPHGMHYANKKGGLDKRQAEATIQYRDITNDGSWVDMGTAHFDAATTDKLQVVKSVTDLTPSKYEVRVTKMTADSDDDYKEETTLMWSMLKEGVDEELIYPGIAKYGVKALATDQLSGSQPTYTCLVRRLTVPIYNPNTEETLDKSAKNPAWATYHFLNVYHGIAAERLIYEEFEEWADHCDSLVVDDFETFGIVLDTQTTLWEDAQRIARIGRASIIRRGTKIGVFVDKQEDPDTSPTHMFTTGNILKETFVYQYLPLKDRANVIELSYVDPDREYTNQIVSVFLEEYTETQTMPKKTNIKYNAAISRERALQEAVYLLKSNRYLVRTVEFEAEIDSFACTVGDVVYFQHEIPYYKEAYGGRLLHASDSYVELDIDVYVESGVSYAVLVRHQDGTIEEHSVGAVSESKYENEFHLESSFTEVPSSGDLYLFGKMDKVQKLYRIINISRAQDHTRRISCIEYVPDIYEPGGVFVPDNPPVYEQLAVGVTAKEYLTYASDGSYESNISVSWYPATPNTSSHWVVWLVDITNQEADDNSGAVKIVETTNFSYHIGASYISLGNEYKIYITPVDHGPTDTGENTAVVQILGKMAVPDDVTGFSATYDPSKRVVMFSWNEVDNIDLSHYQIRRVSNDAPEDEKNWENAEIRISEVIGHSTVESISEDGEEGTFIYYIKAIDTSGNESDNYDSDDCIINLSAVGDFLPQVDGLEVTSNCKSAKTMTATWNTMAENHPYFSHYKIEKRSYINDPIYNTSYFETEENSYTWEDISANTQYGIRVRPISIASTATLRGPWSDEVQHTTCLNDDPPSIPEMTKLVPGYKVMGVHWTEEDKDIDYYELRRKKEDSEWTIIGTKKGTFTTDTDLDVEATYCYSVRAYDKSGNVSEWSEEICATTLKVGWSDLALESLTAEFINVEYLSALASEMGVLITGYIASESFLENGWEIDGKELSYTGEDISWDEAKHVWNGLYIDANHPMIFMGTDESEHYVLLEPGKCEFYGVVNFWNSPEDWTKIDGGQIHASSSITIGTEDYCFIDDGDIEFHRWFPDIGKHRKVKSLKKIDFGSAVSGEETKLSGYWASKPRITVFPKEIPTFISSLHNQSQKIECTVDDIFYNDSTGVCSFKPLMYTTFADDVFGGSGWIYVNYGSGDLTYRYREYVGHDHDDWHYFMNYCFTPPITVPPGITSIEIRAGFGSTCRYTTHPDRGGSRRVCGEILGKCILRIGDIDYIIANGLSGGDSVDTEGEVFSIGGEGATLQVGISGQNRKIIDGLYSEPDNIYDYVSESFMDDEADLVYDKNTFYATGVGGGIAVYFDSFRPTGEPEGEVTIAEGKVSYIAIEDGEEEDE